MNEDRVHDFGSRLFLFFSVDLIPEMGRELTDLLFSDCLLVHFVLLDQLAELVAEDVVVPVRILHELLAYFFLEVWLDRESSRMHVAAGFEELPESFVSTRSEPTVLVLFA